MIKLLRARVLVLVLVFLALAQVVKADSHKVMISNVADLPLGNWTFASLSANDPVCVYHENNDPTYTVTVTDTPDGGFFLKRAGSAAQIPFTMLWSNTAAPGAIALSNGVAANAAGADLRNTTCNGGNTANYTVNVSNSSLAAVPSGTYTATITIRINP